MTVVSSSTPHKDLHTHPNPPFNNFFHFITFFPSSINPSIHPSISIRPTKQHHEALHHPLPKQHPETNRPPPTSTGPSSPSSANPTRSCTTPFTGREITNWWVRRLICRISICLRAQCHEASLSRARTVRKGEGSPVVIWTQSRANRLLSSRRRNPEDPGHWI